jgi:hypothetical protein
VSLTRHLQLLGVLTEPVSGPDRLGPWLSAFGMLALNYKWASEELHPGFP